MTVRVYNSAQASAPVLTGEAGKLTDLLYAVLVTGYGAETGAGWTRPYTGTNGAVFMPGSGLQYCLNVDDNGPGLGTFKEARVRGYETMSAFGTGTNPFPTVAQAASGVFWRKSATADATARGWYCVADERTVHLFMATGDSAGVYFGVSFGEIYSFKPGDTGRVLLVGRLTENSATLALEKLDYIVSLVGTLDSASYLARDTAGTVGAIPCAKMGDMGLRAATAGGTFGSLAFKNPTDQRIYLAPLRVHQAQGGYQVRGHVRGLWHFCHAVATVSDRDTITGAGDLAGKTFTLLKDTGNSAVYCVETSDTWNSN